MRPAQLCSQFELFLCPICFSLLPVDLTKLVMQARDVWRQSNSCLQFGLRMSQILLCRVCVAQFLMDRRITRREFGCTLQIRNSVSRLVRSEAHTSKIQS